MRTTDYNGDGVDVDNLLLNEKGAKIEDLRHIANIRIDEIKFDENSNILIFPPNWNEYHDDIYKKVIFTLSNDKKLKTNSIMGFIGRNNTQLTISSRFEKDEKHDYFLHYMLQRIFKINIMKFDQTTDKEHIWDFLLYLFPYYLKKAFSQGLYKAYRREEYNDANVKGAINVKRHIGINIPFCGKIAYTIKEYSYDNPVTQLIRHTIEYIKMHPYGSVVLSSDSDIYNIVNQFCFLTQNSYKKNSMLEIIRANQKPVSHPYFFEYKILQKICLQILQHGKLSFGSEKDKIYGLLFDGAWLWEEYLDTVLKHDFEHPNNRTGSGKRNLFEDFQPIYPDFIREEQPAIVGDAKYIPLGEHKNYDDDSERATSIYYKTITYMYRFSSKFGFLLFPDTKNSDIPYRIKKTDGILRKLGLAIPKDAEDFMTFIEKMNTNEQMLIKKLRFPWEPKV